MREVSIPEFHAELKAQGVQNREDLAFRCPKCGTVQSAADLIRAGAGATFDDVERYLAFSCIGRFSGAEGCNWTLGGLFQIHTLAVVDEDGKKYPRFEPATPEEAKAHAAREVAHA